MFDKCGAIALAGRSRLYSLIAVRIARLPGAQYMHVFPDSGLHYSFYLNKEYCMIFNFRL